MRCGGLPLNWPVSVLPANKLRSKLRNRCNGRYTRSRMEYILFCCAKKNVRYDYDDDDDGRWWWWWDVHSCLCACRLSVRFVIAKRCFCDANFVSSSSSFSSINYIITWQHDPLQPCIKHTTIHRVSVCVCVSLVRYLYSHREQANKTAEQWN